MALPLLLDCFMLYLSVCACIMINVVSEYALTRT